MFGYWLSWSLLTIFKGGMLGLSIVGAIGGVLYWDKYALLAILFVPCSLWFLYDYVWQLLLPFIGGRGYRLHKPIDTPMYMGLAPPYKEAKEITSKGLGIIWD